MAESRNSTGRTNRVLHAFVGPHKVGRLADDQGIWSFTYHEAWLASPDRFPIAPGLPLQSSPIVDTGSNRPVQWYFDNLLPEEGVRELLAKDASIDQADAFALLRAYGSESAGSLTLTPEEEPVLEEGLVELSELSLSSRIERLPRIPLTAGAPKRMSLAGAQHKLLVVQREGRLYEPEGITPSTRILKPDHPDAAYPHTVINEYFSMRLAGALRMNIPSVARRYVPQPVYLIDRFDRIPAGAKVQRLHAIDACQLLNLDRQFKYHAASLQRLPDIAARCSNVAAARIRLFTWLAFNTLIGNSDAHLKNLSFLVDRHGIHLAPHYDLLASSVYDMKAFHADGRWPDVELTWQLGRTRVFGEIDGAAFTAAAEALEIAPATAKRILRQLTSQIEVRASALAREIQSENETLLASNALLAPVFAGEMRLVRAIQTVIHEMTTRIN